MYGPGSRSNPSQSMVIHHRQLALAVTAAAIFSCADTEFKSADSGVNPQVDTLIDTTSLWPDQSPLPDYVPESIPLEMYAHSKGQLFAIDPQSLELTLVGDFGPEAPDINDLAVTPTGELYGIAKNDLFQIDHETAEVTHVTTLEGNANVALTFEVSGTLLASDKEGALRRIDPVTGDVTEIGLYGDGLGESGDLVAIKDGTLFGVNDKGETAFDDNELMTIDPQTGAATIIGPIGFDHVWGLAYWKGTIYGLTKAGDMLAIDPVTGEGTRINKYEEYEFWGAAVTPNAPID